MNSVDSRPVPVAASLPAAADSPALLEFWWRHARLPLGILIFMAAIFDRSGLDQWIANQFFYDGLQHRWIGAHSVWVNQVLHEGGRWLVRGIVASALLLWIGSYVRPDWRDWRRPSLYFTIAMVLALGIVGLLKTWTNIDCPWDLQEFGGRFPYYHLFAHRPAVLRHAQCFPAAHASSGYALMALYFVSRERSAWWKRVGLLVGLTSGLIFGIAQQSRGAHFISHDVWSACITWLVALTVYTFVFRARIWTDSVR